MFTIKVLLFNLIGFFYTIFRPSKRCPLYGIEGYFGLMGSGKTICMTKRLNDIKKQYGDDVHIITNYGYKWQDERFRHWSQLFKDYGKPLVVAWDEVQNEFNSRNFKTFPTELLTILTQVRKRNGVLLLYSAQRIQRVDKVFRELTQYSWDCHSIGRTTWCCKYDTFRMIAKESMVNEENRANIKLKGYDVFLQTDKLRNDYDSFQLLDSVHGRLKTDRFTPSA